MSKEKVKNIEDISSILSLEKLLISKYGKDILTLGSNIKQENKMVVPISPAIDSICGGIEEGGMVNIGGPPGCGKSTMALVIAANAQKEQYGSRPIFYIDGEYRLKKKNLEGINGLDAEKVNVIRSSRERVMCGEEFCDIAINIFKNYHRAVVIMDSVSSMCPSSEITENVSGSLRSTSPRLLASFCRQLTGVLGPSSGIFLSLHHLISNSSGFGEAEYLSGGKSLFFAADTRLVSKGKPKVWIDKDGKSIGQISTWTAVKTSIGSPNGVAESFIRFGYGIDGVVEVVNMAIELGIIHKGGPWYTLPFVSEETKFQGQEKVNDYIRENPQLIETMKQKIMEMQ